MAPQKKYTVDNKHFFSTKAALLQWQADAAVKQQAESTCQPPKLALQRKIECRSDLRKSVADFNFDFWNATKFHQKTPPSSPVSRRRRRHDRYSEGDAVVFISNECRHPGAPDWSAERHGSVARTGQIRRGLKSRASGQRVETIYRVRLVGNSSKVGRVETVPEDRIEYPQENIDRKMRSALERVFLSGLRRGFDVWIDVVLFEREQEQRRDAVETLQRFSRCVLGKAEFQRRFRLAEVARALANERRKAARRAERAERKRRLLEERKRREGFTADGEHYFLTRAEMTAFYRRQEKACKRAFNAMCRMAHGATALAFDRWRYYIENVLPPAHFDFGGIVADGFSASTSGVGDCSPGGSGLAELLKRRAHDDVVAFKERRAAQRRRAPWHPAVDMKLPGLPFTGVRSRANGTLEILDVTRYNSFKSFQSGPTDACSWLTKGAHVKVLFGAYPEGQSRLDAERITARSSSCAALLVQGVDTFVCLMTADEIRRKAQQHPNRLRYDEVVDATCATIREELVTGVKSCKDAHEFAAKRAERGRTVGYAKPQQQALDRAEANRLQDYKKSKAFFDNFAERVSHLHFPIPPGGVADGPEIILLCEELERRIRAGERLYIFSGDGCGRVGILAALLLSRMYGMNPDAALDRVQRYHHAQRRFAQCRPGEAPSCPKSIAQRQQVVALLQFTEPAFDSVVRRGGARGVESKMLTSFRDPVSWVVREQKRDAGPPSALPASTHKICDAEREEIDGMAHGREVTALVTAGGGGVTPPQRNVPRLKLSTLRGHGN